MAEDLIGIALFRRIVENWQYEEFEGVLIDATTANFVCQVYDKLSPENQANFGEMHPFVMVDMTMKLIARTS